MYLRIAAKQGTRMASKHVAQCRLKLGRFPNHKTLNPKFPPFLAATEVQLLGTYSFFIYDADEFRA